MLKLSARLVTIGRKLQHDIHAWNNIYVDSGRRQDLHHMDDYSTVALNGFRSEEILTDSPSVEA